MKKRKAIRKLLSLILVFVMLFPGESVLAETEEIILSASDATERMISMGSYHSAFLGEDGSLWLWGGNTSGQIGNGTTTRQKEPLQVMDGVKYVALGHYHSAAIKEDGSLWCWGYNGGGQVGNGTTTQQTEPVWIMDDVRYISLGAQCTAAIKEDGSLWTWGYNAYGALGDGTNTTRTEPVKIMDHVKDVSFGDYHCAAVKEDGSLWIWGSNYDGQLGNGTTSVQAQTTPLQIMDGVKSVSLGEYFSAAIKEDKTLWMWGLNKYGQCGNGTTTNQTSPVMIMENVKSVSLGYEHSAAVKEDGSLWVWGRNYYSQLGDGTSTDQTTPIELMTDVKSVALGVYHSAALKEDGSLWMWGDNYQVQISETAGIRQTEPLQIIIPLAGDTVAEEVDSSEYIDSANITYHYPASDGTRKENYFLYSDHMFYVNEESIHYRHELAKASLAAVMAGFSDARLEPQWTETIPVTEENEYGRACNIAEFYDHLNFRDAVYVNYEVPLNNSDDKVAYSMARKYVNRGEDSSDTSQGEDTVIAVILRGGGYGAEWASNFKVLDENYSAKDHFGFASAAGLVKEGLDEYVNELKEAGGIRGDLKLWVCGYSRAAATANRLAHVINNSGVAGEEIAEKNLYAYTFATPNVAKTGSGENTEKDDNIFNIVSAQDLVPTVPLVLWGYKKYGNTLYLPVEPSTTVNEKYCSLSGKSLTGENTPISMHQGATVMAIDNLLGSIFKIRVQYYALQPSLMILFEDWNKEYSPKSSDEKYVEISEMTISNLPSVWYESAIYALGLTKNTIMNLGRVHEPENYFARLDSMTEQQITAFSSKPKTTFLKLFTSSAVQNSINVSFNQAAQLAGCYVEEGEDDLLIYLVGDDAEVSISSGAATCLDMEVITMDGDGQESHKVSYGSVDFSNGTYSYDAGSESLRDYDGLVYTPDYDSTEVSESYTLTVVGGYVDGSDSIDTDNGVSVGSAASGELVSIYAVTADEKQQFKCWMIDEEESDRFGDAANAMTTFRMPAHDVTITAVSEPIISKTKIKTPTNTAKGIKVSWYKNSDVTGYYIYRKTGNSSYQKVKTITSASTTNWTDTKAAKNGSRYQYKIVGYVKADGNIYKSKASSGKTIYRLSATTIRKLTSKAAGKMTVQWKKNSKATGYQIQYAQKSSFSGAKKVTVKSAKSVRKTIASLKKGKNYYVRVRAYKKISGKTYYSSWSAKKRVNILQ